MTYNKEHEIERRGPFKVTSRRIAYENPWIRVVEDRVIHPDDRQGIFGVIEIRCGRGGVAILPIDKDKRIYLIREFMYAINRYDVKVAGGGVEEGEDALFAAKREFREEFGVSAATWTPLGHVTHAPNIIRGGAQLFLAQDFDVDKLSPEEGIEVFTYDLEAAVQMVMEGAITSSTTCCLILKVARLLEV
ncbi:MAG: NUDIX hydrolase [Prochloraceae cyanobacterium]|nr:NUDIX hydrolase [Prochloraceae cyanobacterium]